MRIVLTAFLVLLASCGTAVAAPTQRTPLTFAVENVNRSKLACPADGAKYELRGWLTQPAGAPTDSVTLYLHEFTFGSHFWRFPDARYDYADALAREGHASVVIDRLGYGDSPAPPGTATCLGAAADMASQIVQQLRQRGFKRVALAGHSAGASVAEVAYHSFGGVDALVLFGWAHTGYSADVLSESAMQGGVCTRGGEPKRQGGSPGYAFFSQTVERFRLFSFHDAEQTVFDRMVALRERDPCGDVATLTASVAFNRSQVKNVTAPVLLVMGDEDRVYDKGTGPKQRDSYTGSNDVTLIEVPRAAHAMTLEKTAPGMRAAIARWMGTHGLSRPPVAATTPPAAAPAPAPSPAPRVTTRTRTAPSRGRAKPKRVTRRTRTAPSRGRAKPKRVTCRKRAGKIRNRANRRAALKRCSKVKRRSRA